MKGGLEGWREGWKGGAGYPGDSSKEDRMSETRRKKKKGGRCLSFSFHGQCESSEGLLTVCCLLAEWIFEP